VMGEGNSDFWPCKREGETERERDDNDRFSSSSSYLSFHPHHLISHFSHNRLSLSRPDQS